MESIVNSEENRELSVIHSVCTLNVINIVDIIILLRTGADFYIDVIDNTDNINIKRIFVRTIQERESAIDDLAAFIFDEHLQIHAQEYLRNRDITLCANIQYLYRNLLANLCFDEEHSFISQLQAVENKTIKAFDVAIRQHNINGYGHQLYKIKTTMQRCLDDLKVLQLITPPTVRNTTLF